MIKKSILENLIGKINTESDWLDFSLDTRTYTEGQIFFAITGDRYNAVDSLPEIINKKCKLVIYTDSTLNTKKVNSLLETNTTFIPVKDTIE